MIKPLTGLIETLHLAYWFVQLRSCLTDDLYRSSTADQLILLRIHSSWQPMACEVTGLFGTDLRGERVSGLGYPFVDIKSRLVEVGSEDNVVMDW